MHVTTPNGGLECLTGGMANRTRAPIVLVHGIQGTAGVWNPVLPRLSGQRPVIAPHLRGRAGSFSPNDPAAYTMRGFAEDLCAVIETVEGPVVLVGWSMGSLVALEYIQTYGQDRLIGLALVSGSPCLASAGGGDAVWFQGDTPEALAENAAERAKRLQLTETATNIAVAGSWMSARTADYRGTLGAIRLPTLVLHGAEDPECPVAHARLMTQSLPAAQLKVWAGCGHVPMAHAPDDFASKLMEFADFCDPPD